jgi:dTDP-4-amino-4,6-dideoxy-D-galactose acyltransferase
MTACVQTSAPCELLPWDSNFFQFRIARVHGNTLDDARAREVEAWSRSERVRCLYFLARADCPDTIKTAEKNGFGLVDVRVTFERQIPQAQDFARLQRSDAIIIRPFRPVDLPVLEALAASSHRDTRFFNDPHFPRSLAEALYSTWLRLECQGRALQVLVAATIEGGALGYVSCHLDSAEATGQIGLIAVSPEARGKGIGKNLVLSALDWFESQGAQRAIVVTQGGNVPAQRLYQGCGFLTRDVRLWYHKWYPLSRSEND